MGVELTFFAFFAFVRFLFAINISVRQGYKQILCNFHTPFSRKAGCFVGERIGDADLMHGLSSHNQKSDDLLA